MQFVVYRNNWRHGGCNHQKHGFTSLLNNKGYRCCLGFVCQQLGVSDEGLMDIGTPRCINDNEQNLLKGVLFFYGLNNMLAFNAVIENDNKHLSNSERERRLTALFKEHGHELVFEGEYPDDQA